MAAKVLDGCPKIIKFHKVVMNSVFWAFFHINNLFASDFSSAVFLSSLVQKQNPVWQLWSKMANQYFIKLPSISLRFNSQKQSRMSSEIRDGNNLNRIIIHRVWDSWIVTCIFVRLQNLCDPIRIRILIHDINSYKRFSRIFSSRRPHAFYRLIIIVELTHFHYNSFIMLFMEIAS